MLSEPRKTKPPGMFLPRNTKRRDESLGRFAP